MKTKHFFITGLPFVGKTTALLRIVQSLDHAYGCVTQAVKLEGKRTGLNIITSPQHIYKVASSSSVSAHRIGKYSVDITALNGAIQEILNHKEQTRYIYLDEIGTLFCQSAFFINTVRSLFESHILIGVIAKKGHPFIKEIHQRPDCCFMEITADNRDDIPNAILKTLKPS